MQFELPYLGTGAAGAPGRGAGLQDRPAYPVHAAAGGGQLVDAVPEPELDAAGRCRGPDPPFEGRDHAWPGAPGDVEAGHRVAVPVGQVAAALGPADQREPAHPQRVQPGPLLRRGEVDVRLGPPVRPVVLAGGVIDPAVEAGAAEPVLPGQLAGVLDAQAPLLGRAHQEQAAEGPERLTAQVRLGLLVQQQYPPAASASSAVATRPASPAPTTITSLSAMPPCSLGPRVWSLVRKCYYSVNIARLAARRRGGGPPGGPQDGLRASMRNRTLVAANDPSAAIRSCSASSRSRYAPAVKPGTIQITFRRKCTRWPGR